MARARLAPAAVLLPLLLAALLPSLPPAAARPVRRARAAGGPPCARQAAMYKAMRDLEGRSGTVAWGTEWGASDIGSFGDSAGAQATAQLDALAENLGSLPPEAQRAIAAATNPSRVSCAAAWALPGLSAACTAAAARNQLAPCLALVNAPSFRTQTAERD